MGVQPIDQEPFDVDSRRAARDPINVSAELNEHGEESHEILVGDLSSLGFMAITPKAYSDHALVRLNLPLVGEIDARVVWSSNDRIGLEFTSRNALRINAFS